MERSQAVEVLKQVAQLAQKGGLLTLEDVPTVLQAIQTLEKEEVKEVEQEDE
jgi:hypothetical protein